jgi:N-acyl-L-homoserine lactone synthetase
MTTNSIVIGRRIDLAHEVLEAMHRLRYSVFIDRLQWRRPLIDHIEIDEFDTDECVYLVARNANGEVTSTARMFPTSGGCMLSYFPQLLGAVEVPADPSIWELGRFATNIRATREGRYLTCSKESIELLDLARLYAQRCRVKRLVMVTPVSIETLLLRTNLEFHRMGQPAIIDEVRCVALGIDVPVAAEFAPAKVQSRPHWRQPVTQ